MKELMNFNAFKKVALYVILSGFVATLAWGFVQIRDIPEKYATYVAMHNDIDASQKYICDRLNRVERKVDKLLFHFSISNMAAKTSEGGG